ncbi:hypothetical protein pdam_00020978 [Pocillopora damicornis]|uniref:Uncharacterized protein n=1 Tax=Pocillopora damicornis TaxID=46731 RepID=A0A3M6UV56_POCDA|nr:hypothetical protein pdam_00020978 [Pocillopora damicornis]
MWLPLRAAGLQGSRVLHNLASFLSDVALACRAPRVLHPSISLLTEMEVLGLRTWLDSKTASPLESAGHNIAWLDQLGGEYSCWCAAFAVGLARGTVVYGVQVDVRGDFSPSRCSTTSCQLACGSDLWS